MGRAEKTCTSPRLSDATSRGSGLGFEGADFTSSSIGQSLTCIQPDRHTYVSRLLRPVRAIVSCRKVRTRTLSKQGPPLPNYPDLSALPLFPRDAEGPVFREPWEAQAFALAVQLQERGLFAWDEWAEALGSEIAAAQKCGDPDLGDTYYRHWLSALERLVVAKGAASQRSEEH